jgi:hypothetical protein
MAKAKTETTDSGAPETVRLRHPEQWSGTFTVGEIEYTVTDGEVDVVVEHVAAALQAGFRTA